MAETLAVIIPAGPSSTPVDTVESIQYYCKDADIIIVNDTGASLTDMRLFSRVHIISPPPRAEGGYGGLFLKVVSGIRSALEISSADILLKMDVDALVTNYGLSHHLHTIFSSDPTLGVLGAYTTGPHGRRRDWSPARAILRHETGLLGLRHLALRQTVRRAVRRARRSGYVDGEHVLGGAYALSRSMALDLCEDQLLTDRSWGRSKLGEDHIFGIAALALGYRLGDGSAPGDPLAIEWRGLSTEPVEILRQGKMLVHSVDYSGTLSEDKVRAVFREARIPDRSAPPR